MQLLDAGPHATQACLPDFLPTQPPQTRVPVLHPGHVPLILAQRLWNRARAGGEQGSADGGHEGLPGWAGGGPKVEGRVPTGSCLGRAASPLLAGQRLGWAVVLPCSALPRAPPVSAGPASHSALPKLIPPVRGRGRQRPACPLGWAPSVSPLSIRSCCSLCCHCSALRVSSQPWRSRRKGESLLRQGVSWLPR